MTLNIKSNKKLVLLQFISFYRSFSEGYIYIIRTKNLFRYFLTI